MSCDIFIYLSKEQPGRFHSLFKTALLTQSTFVSAAADGEDMCSKWSRDKYAQTNTLGLHTTITWPMRVWDSGPSQNFSCCPNCLDLLFIFLSVVKNTCSCSILPQEKIEIVIHSACSAWSLFLLIIKLCKKGSLILTDLFTHTQTHPHKRYSQSRKKETRCSKCTV